MSTDDPNGELILRRTILVRDLIAAARDADVVMALTPIHLEGVRLRTMVQTLRQMTDRYQRMLDGIAAHEAREQAGHTSVGATEGGQS